VGESGFGSGVVHTRVEGSVGTTLCGFQESMEYSAFHLSEPQRRPARSGCRLRVKHLCSLHPPGWLGVDSRFTRVVYPILDACLRAGGCPTSFVPTCWLGFFIIVIISRILAPLIRPRTAIRGHILLTTLTLRFSPVIIPLIYIHKVRPIEKPYYAKMAVAADQRPTTTRVNYRGGPTCGQQGKSVCELLAAPLCE